MAVEEHGYQGVRGGDLVIHSMDGFAGAIGVSDSDGKASPVVHCYRARPGVDARFYAYVLRHLAVTGFISSLAKGIRERSTAFDAETFRSMVLPCPRAMEQRAIADFLDTATARANALVAKKRRMIDLLEERWRNEVRQQMKRLGDEYGWIALKRVIDCLDGRRIPLSAEERAGRPGEYPYFGASGQIDTVDNYLFDEVLVLLGEDGAQLADPDYEISTVVTGRVWVNNHAHVLRPVRADAWFLSMHLSTVDRALVISGATREKITQADMNQIPVPDAPLAEQARVSAELRLHRSHVESLTARLESQIRLLQEHRQALITTAVTGDLEVPGAAT